MKPFKPGWKFPVLCSVCCAAVSALAVWQALTENNGRLVYPMHSYSFQPPDIPMLLAIGLDSLFVLYLLALLVRAILNRRTREKTARHTRRISPKCGFLGFLGLLGLAGAWTYPAYGNYTPFCFFVFFGFFGFFFEGKMSHTLMDERYQENAIRAQLKAYHTGMGLIFLLLIFVGQGAASPRTAAAVMLSGVALAIALTLFLSEYLLYRYDQSGVSGDE